LKYKLIDDAILNEITSILELERFNIPKDQLLSFMVDREQKGALELLTPYFYWDEMMETQKRI
jgi:hypothetical protein